MSNPKREYYSSGEIQHEEWYQNGKYHRTDGPAIITYHMNGEIACKEWLLNEKLHRTDGPAIIDYNLNGKIDIEYWILNGRRIYPKKWLQGNGYNWPLTEDQQTELTLTFA